MLALIMACAASGGAAPPAGDYVSREEYDKLKREQEEMRRELAEIKRERAVAEVVPAPAPKTAGTAAPAPTAEDYDDLAKQLLDLRHRFDEVEPGSSVVALHGDASIDFVSQQKTHSTFSATYSPLLLYKPTEKLLFEAAVDLSGTTDNTGNSTTDVTLTIAEANYLLNDYMTVGAGLFVSPFATYHKHFDPPWVNKLPDDPLVFSDGGLAPSSELGIYLNGVAPLNFHAFGKNWNTRFLYDVFVSDGPNLSVTDPASAGALQFNNYTDLNNNKAVGGRLAFSPFPALEVGYSIEYGKANPANFPGVNILLQAVDFNYVQDVPQIRGFLTIRSEWVWSDVRRATYDPTGAAGFGPLRFRNARDGGYVLLAYRPTHLDNKVLRNFEFVARFDALTVPLSAPGGEHERRWTLGADYWLTPSWVLKAAYEFDHRENSPGQNALLLQLGIGF